MKWQEIGSLGRMWQEQRHSGIGGMECDTHHWHVVLLGGALSQSQRWWAISYLALTINL